MLIEYRVRPVTRYVVTRFETSGPSESGCGQAGSSTRGQFENEEVAFEVAYALCKAEHDALGWAEDDSRISYPARQVCVSPPAKSDRQSP